MSIQKPNKRFMVRVYGILRNSFGEVLLTKEMLNDKTFTKFPGGGLQWGESTINCLKREIQEELSIQIDGLHHIYTCEEVVINTFNTTEQVIGIYYQIRNFDPESLTVNSIQENGITIQTVQWIPVGLVPALLSFEMDKKAWEVFTAL